MTGGISISVQGGAANFGNVVQGSHNKIVGGDQRIEAPADQAFAAVFQALQEEREKQISRQADIDALQADLKELQQASQQGKSSRWGSIADGAKVLYEKYGWAADPLRKLFAILVPGFPAF